MQILIQTAKIIGIWFLFWTTITLFYLVALSGEIIIAPLFPLFLITSLFIYYLPALIVIIAAFWKIKNKNNQAVFITVFIPFYTLFNYFIFTITSDLSNFILFVFMYYTPAFGLIAFIPSMLLVISFIPKKIIPLKWEIFRILMFIFIFGISTMGLIVLYSKIRT